MGTVGDIRPLGIGGSFTGGLLGTAGGHKATELGIGGRFTGRLLGTAGDISS